MKKLLLLTFLFLTGCVTTTGSAPSNPTSKQLAPIVKNVLSSRLFDMNENLKAGVQEKIDSGEFYQRLNANLEEGLKTEVITTAYQKQLLVEKAIDKTISSIDEIVPRISLPKVSNSGITRSPFTNTQKNVIRDTKSKFTFDVYYGSGGRYLVFVHPPKDMFVDFTKAEGNLFVDRNGYNPETLSLAIDKQGLMSGSGDSRKGKLNLELNIMVPGTQYHDRIDLNVSFEIVVDDASVGGN